jgi:MFS family permease
VGSLATWSFVMVLTGLVSAPWQLLAMRGALGLVEAMYLPAALALVSEYHGQSTRASAMGVVAGVTLSAWCWRVGLAGYLGEFYGWRTPLMVLGVAGLCLLWSSGSSCPRDGGPEVPAFLIGPQLSLFHAPRASYCVFLRSSWVLRADGHRHVDLHQLAAPLLPGEPLDDAGHRRLLRLLRGQSEFGGRTGRPRPAGSDRVARGGAHRRMLLQALLIACAAPLLLAFVLTRNHDAISTSRSRIDSFCAAVLDLNLLPLTTDLAGPNRSSTAVGLTNMANNLTCGARRLHRRRPPSRLRPRRRLCGALRRSSLSMP